jgi:pyruvate/2-oxoglutarate dehydrogenase complex dihydrolipoamide dehydrogenase (E3) component
MTSDLADHDQLWRAAVFPADYRNPVPAARYNLVVIGAGPAGLITAIAAAGLGARVALVERHAMGGDCLNVGCVPSKTLLAEALRGADFPSAMRRVREVRAAIAPHDSVQRYREAGVDVFLGAAQFVDAHTVAVGDALLRGRRFAIATGARAALPPIDGLAAAEPLTNESVFDLDAQPRRLLVLGGGPIGCELSQAFARLGTEVSLLEAADRILGNDDPDAARQVAASLERDGVRIVAGAQVQRVERQGALRTLVLGDGRRFDADQLLVAAGRRRNVENLGLEKAGVEFDVRTGIRVDARLRTTVPHIFALGDVASVRQFTHNADAQARIVIRNALFLGRARADRLVIPWCTYTKPELAQVGATRVQLEQAGTPFQSFRVDFGALDRGRTDRGDDGFAQVLVAQGSDRILGATIVGRDAGEQIAPLVMLMTLDRGLGALGSLVLPYPTRSEYLRRLADAWNRTRLTPRSAATLRWWLGKTR